MYAVFCVDDLPCTWIFRLQGKVQDGRGFHHGSAGRRQRQETEPRGVRQFSLDLLSRHGYPQRSQL